MATARADLEEKAPDGPDVPAGSGMERALVLATAAVAVHYTDTDRTSRFEAFHTAYEVTVEPDEPMSALAGRITAAAPPEQASADAQPCVFRLALEADHVRVDHPDPVTADATARIWATLLAHTGRDASRPVAGYPVLREQDREGVLVRFNATARDFPADTTLHQFLRSQARRSPEAIAVSSDAGALTYRELDERTDALAARLTAELPAACRVVGVLARRSTELPVALFAVLKAGRAYLPLDPHAPEMRHRQLVAHSGAGVVLSAVDTPVDFGVPLWDLRDPVHFSAPAGPLPETTPHDLAYVIYTSGSTGTPKGVMVSHRSVVNRLAWMQRRYPLGPGDTLLQKTPAIFDVSVWELFWWALTGSRMHLLAPGMERFPMAVVETAEREGVTALHFVPSMLAAFLAHLRSTGDAARLHALRWLFSSGESLTGASVAEFGELFQGKGTLVNLYGPTEATVDVTSHDCPRQPERGRVPIGSPIDNVRCYVLRYGNALPVGAFGSLHLAGECVARGYLGDPVLTARSFVPEYGDDNDNDNGDGDGDGDGRMYDTGDIVRWLPSGELDFLGRRDTQVKIRGIRIDVTEIEDALHHVPGVRECAVTVHHAGTVLATLRAAVTGEGLTREVLRDHLARRLPPYLVPTGYDLFTELPRTGSGKIDRRLLADAAHVRAHRIGL
ncbi:amino acid adenylation domain-containing protein [Streptomyces sp. NPDC090445]|uniref:amino acid adenylation domain-containing protein n=1 Tax=Streptomyces sp. NPDC090445 TaxID=3365963 RepID=UPI003825DF9B